MKFIWFFNYQSDFSHPRHNKRGFSTHINHYSAHRNELLTDTSVFLILYWRQFLNTAGMHDVQGIDSPTIWSLGFISVVQFVSFIRFPSGYTREARSNCRPFEIGSKSTLRTCILNKIKLNSVLIVVRLVGSVDLSVSQWKQPDRQFNVLN